MQDAKQSKRCQNVEWLDQANAYGLMIRISGKIQGLPPHSRQTK